MKISTLKTVIIVIYIGICGFLHSQEKPVTIQNLKQEGIIGNVKSVLEWGETMLLSGERGYKYMEYNQSGNQTLYKQRFSGNSPKISSTVHKYDSIQNLIETSFYKDSVLVEQKVYKYDSANRLILKSSYFINDVDKKEVFLYDESGGLVESQQWYFLSEDRLFSRDTYEYYKNGNLKSWKHYRNFTEDLMNLLMTEYSYKYDEKNNRKEQVYKARHMDSVVNTTINTYNRKGQITKTMRYENGRLISETNYTKIKNNVNLEVVQSFDEQPESKLISRYNEKGLPTEILNYKNDVLVNKETYWYEYDTQGNWIKKYNSRNESKPHIKERELEYY